MKKSVLQEPTPRDAHPQHSVRRQIIVSVSVTLLLIAATVLIILYGKGFRPYDDNGTIKVSKTGILNLTSSPAGAQVYVNDHLTTATDGSINLTPGKYKIKIAKDGYQDWQKDFQIEREVVSNADATLYPKAPTLQGMSTFGIQSAFVDPTGTKLAFNIASNSARKNGIYVFDMSTRNFPVLAGQSSATQIVDDTTDTFSSAKITWSPDSKQMLASIVAPENGPTTYYLLKTDSLNNPPQDITATYTTTLDLWKQQRKDKEAVRIKSLKSPVQKFLKNNFRVLSWSPDESEILYQASQSADMPVMIKPRHIGNNLLYERRDLKENAIYVYNVKEDINTRLVDSINTICTDNLPDCDCTDVTKCVNPFTWFSDSGHLLYVNENKISIIEADGSNLTTLYAGPFVDHYVFPWTDGSKIVILTNFNSLTPTLYSIGLK